MTGSLALSDSNQGMGFIKISNLATIIMLVKLCGMAESHVYATVRAFGIHYYDIPWHPHNQNEQRVGVSYKLYV